MYVDNEKIGGMLIENIIQGSRWKYAIIGIGLNVNQQGFPPEAAHATSLIKILHSDYDLQTLLAELCSSIERWYLKLRSGKIKEIQQTYINKLYQLNTLARYRANEEIFEAELVDVDEQGLLQLYTGKEVKSFNIKEVEFLR
ncbi:MAG: biotin--(Acetyl-CoA carboxylase) synthetase [Sphingobacteriaceae bacterium]|nr:biotin--(Acetyl-CoA carboxylase) synthetase [Sphingobacteriaceae bacterium]